MHIDHIQAVHKIKKISGGHVKIYAHWIEAEYLASNPKYQEPPSHEVVTQIPQKYGINIDDLIKRFVCFVFVRVALSFSVSSFSFPVGLAIINSSPHFICSRHTRCLKIVAPYWISNFNFFFLLFLCNSRICAKTYSYSYSVSYRYIPSSVPVKLFPPVTLAPDGTATPPLPGEVPPLLNDDPPHPAISMLLGFATGMLVIFSLVILAPVGLARLPVPALPA